MFKNTALLVAITFRLLRSRLLVWATLRKQSIPEECCGYPVPVEEYREQGRRHTQYVIISRSMSIHRFEYLLYTLHLDATPFTWSSEPLYLQAHRGRVSQWEETSHNTVVRFERKLLGRFPRCNACLIFVIFFTWTKFLVRDKITWKLSQVQ